MKRVIIYCFGVGLLAAAVAYGSTQLYGILKTQTANAETCKHVGTNHSAVIKDGKMVPEHTTGHLCDTLTISNTDDVLRLIAFGQHDNHQPYDGVTEKTLGKGQDFTITLNETGDYTFHDHLHDEVAGTFSVKR